MAVATIRYTDLKMDEKIDGNWIAHIGWDVINYTDMSRFP